MPTTVSPLAAKSLFAVTVFLGAGLVFQIQPLMSKLILPWFGGSPGVWTVCLLFFQSLLFAGYLYAHGLVRQFGLRGQWLIQALLLAVALFSPVLPAAIWKPIGEGDPTGEILLLLAWHVGLPYLLLSATGPLLQVWFARAFPGESPYRLYALSNLGSLLGLVTYPFVVDVWLSAPQQVSLWYGGFVTYSLLCVACGWIADTRDAREYVSLSRLTESASRESSRPRSDGTTVRIATAGASRGVCLLWFGLAMVPSVLLAAVTNKLSVDVSPVPFLWVVPLTLYLISLIVCFSNESWANRWVWGAASAIALLTSGIVIALQHGSGSYGSLPFQFAVHLGTLFCLCMACHGELVRWKPCVGGASLPRGSVAGVGVFAAPSESCNPAGGSKTLPQPPIASARGESLTEFYLIMSAGGAAGGLFVAVVAPALFPMCVELHLGLLAAALLTPMAWMCDSRAGWFHARNAWVWLCMAGVVIPLTIGLTSDVAITLRNVYRISRNFYGVLRVIEHHPETPSAAYNELAHGGTRHGLQPVDPKLARLPTTYYGLTSGVGLALSWHHADRPRRVGLIGLGVGTLATYGRKGDVYDFYEIDPAVRDLATNFFRYLRDTPAKIHLIPGDARLALERREPQQYDVLVLDAFSSDAIPIHLLTAEAFEVYRRHLAPDGVVAVHVSNHYFNLRPIVAGHALRLRWSVAGIAERYSDPELFTVASLWILLSPSAASLEAGVLGRAARVDLGKPLDWTDARHSLFEIMGNSHR
jgi:SAM-dependent methyltransferase